MQYKVNGECIAIHVVIEEYGIVTVSKVFHTVVHLECINTYIQ